MLLLSILELYRDSAGAQSAAHEQHIGSVLFDQDSSVNSLLPGLYPLATPTREGDQFPLPPTSYELPFGGWWFNLGKPSGPGSLWRGSCSDGCLDVIIS